MKRTKHTDPDHQNANDFCILTPDFYIIWILALAI